MADIKITLELDDGQFQQILKKIDTSTKATTDAISKGFADAGEKVKQAAKDIDDFGKSIQQASEKMNGLASAIIGVGLGAFVKSAIEAANNTERMAEAIGVTTAAYLQLSQASIAAGKDQDAMGRMMLRMEATAQQANDGNYRLRDSYAQLGISMEFLKTHSPDQVILAVAEGLNKLESSGKRAEIVMALLGRDAKTVDFEAFAKALKNSNGTMDSFAAANASAARAYRELGAGLAVLKLQVLEILKPIMDLIGDNASGLLGSKVAAEALLAVMAVSTIVATAKAFQILAAAVESLAVWLGLAGAAGSTSIWVKLGTTIGELGAAVASAYRWLASFAEITVVIGGIAATLAVPIEAVAAVFVALAAAAAGVVTVLWKAFGSEAISGLMKGIKTLASGIMDILGGALDWFNKATDKAADKLRGLFGLAATHTQAGATQDAEDMAAGKAASNNNNGTTSGPTLDPIAGQNESLKQQFYLLQLNNNAQVARLMLEKNLVGQSEDIRKSQLAEFDSAIQYAKERLRLTGELKVAEVEQANSIEPSRFKGRIDILKQELKLLDDQSAKVGQYTDELAKAQMYENFKLSVLKEQEKLQKQLNDLQVEYSDIGLTTDQQKLNNLEKQYNAAMKIVKDTLQKQYGSGYDIEGTKEYKEAQDMLGKSLAANRAQMEKNIEQSRDFNTAWKQAYNQFIEDGTNAASQAASYFKVFENGLDTMINNIVTTGKLGFKDLAISIIQELEKIAIKAAAIQVFKSMGLGDIFGSFTGAHADGGFIPSGSFGIVGEKGPEIVNGPANITSTKDTAAMMGGGGDTHNHYYNIQAVDAKSVAQLFAENRQILFGNVEQARKEMPMRTR